MLANKLPRPLEFHDAMEELDAYAGGHSALAFISQCRFYTELALEIFLGQHEFNHMRHHLLEVQRAVCIVDKPIANDAGVLRMSLWRTTVGRVMLYRSMTDDPLLPILHGSSTAVMNYVRPVHFGVIWPRLTFNWRALPGTLYNGPTSYMKAIRDFGFSVRLYYWLWSNEGEPASCGAERFLCPAQPRYIHDAGSFCGTWNPGSVEPLVVPICFRLDTHPCRGVCRNQHIHLSNGSHVAWF